MEMKIFRHKKVAVGSLSAGDACVVEGDESHVYLILRQEDESPTIPVVLLPEAFLFNLDSALDVWPVDLHVTAAHSAARIE